MDPFAFQPGTALLTDRATTEALVATCLQQIQSGVLPSEAERQRVDIKEEAGRRGSGGRLLAGERTNTKAADHLADEVAAMANTPGGGALIVGIEDSTGDLLGTELDPEWLRQQIYRRIDVAPDVLEHIEGGIRLLVIYTPEAREPVEDTSDRIRWRVGSAAVPVDRGQWWIHRQGRIGWDPMARPSQFGAEQATAGAVVVARDYHSRRNRANDAPMVAGSSADDLLRRIGVLTVDGHLTEAGALLFCPAPSPWLTWTRLDVEGGDILAREEPPAATSLLEQIAWLETLLDAANDRITLAGDFAELSLRSIPSRAAREAVLNGVIHRDWNMSAPTTVTWVEEDSSLTVVSPGGFAGGITSENLLTQRFSRSPALADAALALGLVDKQGIGVDRMFREMVTLGHNPPLIREEAGPRIRTRLAGGEPVVPVMRLTTRLVPAARQRDVQVALVLHTLLHRPFVTAESLVPVLQRTIEETREALETTARCVIGGHPVIEPYKDVWLLSRPARKTVAPDLQRLAPLKRRKVLWYLAPGASEAPEVIRFWLANHDRVTSGDIAALAGMTTNGARSLLERHEGDLVERGEGQGRNAHFVRR